MSDLRKSPEHRERVRQARLGSKHTPETRAKMSATRKGRRFSEEHKANLSASLKGKPKSDAARLAMSLAKKGKPGRPQSDAQRAALSARRRGVGWTEAQREMLIGRNSPHWGTPPKHRLRHWYREVSFRSSWEVVVAKELDRLGIAWEYEKHRFDLGECTYLPDFFLPEQGVFWEVKGWLNATSQRKHQLFRELNPDIPLVVATKPLLQLMGL
jgi:hypothetical protein